MLNSSSNSSSDNSGVYVAASYYPSGLGGTIKYYEADEAKKEILDAIKEEIEWLNKEVE